MNADLIPAWAAVPAAILLIVGGLCTVIGSLGLARLKSFYQRMHGPSMGSTLGLGCVLLASMLLSTVTRGYPVLHEILITVFVVTTAPITAMLLMSAAMRRPKEQPRGSGRQDD
jgi:multicomponent K+:H+ antiporter subunit G